MSVRVFSMVAAGSLLAGLLAGQGAASASPKPEHRHRHVLAGLHTRRVALPVRRSLRQVHVRHVKVVQVRGTVRRARLVPWRGHTRLDAAAGGQQPARGRGHAVLAAAMSGGGVSEFAVPTAGSFPEGVAVLPDPGSASGDAFFAESGGDKIGEVKAGGSFTEYPVPSQPQDSGDPQGVTVGADGNLWFTTDSYIGRMTPGGSFTFFPITTFSGPADITEGPDGNVWFTETLGKVGSVTPNGAVTEYSVGAGIHPQYITAMGGSLWFTAFGPGGSNDVFQMTTGGSLTQYVLPSAWIVTDITAGPDGRVWFGSNSTALTAMDSSGSYTTYTWSGSFPNGTQPQYIRPDASGALVFANRSGAIGRMTVTGAVSFTSVPSGSAAVGLAVAADGTIWFSEPAADKIGMLPGGTAFPPAVPVGQTYGCACGTRYTAQTQAFHGAGVNTATGAYTTALTPAQLPGPGPALGFGLAYTSLDTAGGPMGPGWTDAYMASLAFDGSGNATFTAGDGQQIQFTHSGSTYTGGPGVYATLSAVSGGYQVTAPDGTQLNFGSTGQLTSQTDRSGSGVTLAYTGGRVSSVTGTGGRSVGVGYNGSGQLTTLTMPSGHTVTYGYTSGRLASVTDLRGQVTRYGYNSAGQLTTITDPDGHVVLTNAYDPSTGRITSQTDGDGNTTGYGWDPATQTATTTRPGGGIWTDLYNNNVLLEQIDPIAGFTYYSYDANLDLTQVTDPLGSRTEMAYDSAGNMLSMTGPAPMLYQQSWTYNTMDEVLAAQDGRGHTTTYGYDPQGRLTSASTPDNQQSVFTYYADGQLKTATDPIGDKTSYTYNARDDLATVTSPAGRVTTYGYNADGHVTTIKDPSLKTSTATYDSNGNLTVARHSA